MYSFCSVLITLSCASLASTTAGYPITAILFVRVLSSCISDKIHEEYLLHVLI